jgi:TatD DNase family protein
MVDAHCHLQDKKFSDLDEVINKAKENGVDTFICSGTRQGDNRNVLELATKYPEIWATVGIHPEEAGKSQDNSHKDLDDLCKHPKVVGIGETGLDYWEGMREENKANQRKLFEIHINTAKENKLPLVIHNRGAGNEILDYLRNNKVTGLLHSFNGSLNYLRNSLDLGMYIGIGSLITFENRSSLKEIIKYCPKERLVLETDSPYSAPEPFRGSRNTPGNVKIVAEALARILEISVDQAAELTSNNTYALFAKMK